MTNKEDKKVVIVADVTMAKGIEISFTVEQTEDQSNGTRPEDTINSK